MTEALPETARLTADVALFAEQDGQVCVLLVRRRWPPFEDHWALPGGHVDQGEDTETAAYRELREETGVRVGGLRLVGVYADPGRDPRGRYVTWAYTSRVLSFPPQPTAADDATEARWIPVDEVMSEIRVAFDHRRIVADALRVAL